MFGDTRVFDRDTYFTIVRVLTGPGTFLITTLVTSLVTVLGLLVTVTVGAGTVLTREVYAVGSMVVLEGWAIHPMLRSDRIIAASITSLRAGICK